MSEKGHDVQSMTTDLIGTTEAAGILGLHIRKVKRLAQSGDLQHAVKMPGDTGAYLFDRIDVLALRDRLLGEAAAS